MSSPQSFRGQTLGLPADGPGALAGTGRRLLAFIIDAVASGLVAALFVQGRHHTDAASRLPGLWSLVPLTVDYLAASLVTGRTVGMYPMGLRLVRTDARAPIRPGMAVLRIVLLYLLVPALITDRDGRGLHDRVTNTAVVIS